MRLRVGFDGAMLRAPQTGSGQYSAALLEALRERSDIEVVLLSPEPLPTDPDAIIVPPPRFLASERVRKVWWEQIGIGRAARQANARVVHIPYFAAPLRQTIPHVITVHDVIPLLMPAYAGGRAMRAYLRLVSAGTRRAAQVIADSECSRRDAIRVLRLSEERVTTIPLAVRADFGAVRDEALIDQLRERYQLHGKRVIFNVAGLDVRKNVATLLRAFAQVSADRRNFRLVIGSKAHGNAALYPDLTPLVRELGITGSVIFAGAIEADEKIAFYQLADCYVAPSLYEGFGLTPLEAMACGTPVVAADASCTPEVVGDAALLVAPQDVAGFAEAITRVVTNDGALAQQMRQRGRERARQFSWERTATATRAVYRRADHAANPAVAQPSGEQPVEISR